MNNKKAVAIITARGGSKRIPKKNIKDFLGKPIIQYSIDTALESGIFSEVMLSTDDEEIAAIGKELGAVVPFMRSEAASNDFATTAQVLTEVLTRYQELKKDFDFACCIYPTAPFVTAQKLKTAFKILLERNADTVVPVTQFSFPIWRSFKKENGKLAFNWPENVFTRSQDLPPAFHDSGQFYFIRTATFLREQTLFPENTYPLEIPESEVQDIDNEEDWKIAEMKFNFLSQREKQAL